MNFCHHQFVRRKTEAKLMKWTWMASQCTGLSDGMSSAVWCFLIHRGRCLSWIETRWIFYGGFVEMDDIRKLIHFQRHQPVKIINPFQCITPNKTPSNFSPMAFPSKRKTLRPECLMNVNVGVNARRFNSVYSIFTLHFEECHFVDTHLVGSNELVSRMTLFLDHPHRIAGIVSFRLVIGNAIKN